MTGGRAVSSTKKRGRVVEPGTDWNRFSDNLVSRVFHLPTSKGARYEKVNDPGNEVDLACGQRWTWTPDDQRCLLKRFIRSVRLYTSCLVSECSDSSCSMGECHYPMDDFMGLGNRWWFIRNVALSSILYKFKLLRQWMRHDRYWWMISWYSRGRLFRESYESKQWFWRKPPPP